ncbi:MAG: hypothetical protein FWH26_05140 [Oscillospiraceae bacterium]|nr:hypothetical protein [Oscillospiraceae bacterium]
MSYEIYYDRAFIRVGDKYIPMVNHGANNSWEYSDFSGRQVPEKGWHVLNWQRRAQLLFTADEVRKQAALYEEINQRQGMCYKTRHQSFAYGEFGRWIVNGMNNAYTIEEYVSFGNTPFIYDHYGGKCEHYFRTTEEFLALLEALQGKTELAVCFDDNRKVYRPVKPRAKSQPTDDQALAEYFVLKFDLGYFARWRKCGGFMYTFSAAVSSTRKFQKEADAAKYLAKYRERFTRPFTVERIVPAVPQ